MQIRDTFHVARRAIEGNRKRSILTMLGIIIGVGSVVLMTAIGASMEELILSQISSLGSKSMVIFPGQERQGGPNTVFTGYDSLTFEDVNALKKLESITSVAPIVFLAGEISAGSQTTQGTVMGTNENFSSNQNLEPGLGRLLDAGDDEGGRHVAVLGPDTAEDLFGEANPIGKRVTVGNASFTVVGVFKAVGTQFFQNFDERIIVPLSVARSITGQRYASYITMLAAEDFDLAFVDVKWLLRRRHSIENPGDDPAKDDFIVRSSEQANEILGAVSLGLTLFITTIAGISLIVGGIGIMNIMLVAVTERTREIGLRKAVGARRNDILLQFLVESVLLTVIGGIVGVAGGILFAALIFGIVRKFLATYIFALSPGAMVVALAMAAVTGIVFGIYPARRASRLDPIEALRYE